MYTNTKDEAWHMDHPCNTRPSGLPQHTILPQLNERPPKQHGKLKSCHVRFLHSFTFYSDYYIIRTFHINYNANSLSRSDLPECVTTTCDRNRARVILTFGMESLHSVRRLGKNRTRKSLNPITSLSWTLWLRKINLQQNKKGKYTHIIWTNNMHQLSTLDEYSLVVLYVSLLNSQKTPSATQSVTHIQSYRRKCRSFRTLIWARLARSAFVMYRYLKRNLKIPRNTYM